MARIDFEPIGRRVEIETCSTLLEAARIAGIEITAVCGGIGTCEHCRVQVIDGLFSPVTAVEEMAFSSAELAAGWRLACQTEVLDSGKVHIPPGSLTTQQRLQMEGTESNPFTDRAFQFVDLEVVPPDLYDLRSDASRLQDALAASGAPGTVVSYPIMAALSERLRAWDWKLRAAVRDGELRAVLPLGERFLGIAVDIGTTKVAAYLIDIESGETLRRASAMNPQIPFGEDVMSRISYAMEHEQGRSMLQRRIAETLNSLVESMCDQEPGQAGRFHPDQIVEAVVVGNTAMHHFFAGLPVQQLGLLPFVPAVSEPLEIQALALELHLSPGALVHLPANIAGYVGADHVAVILSTEVDQTQDTTMAVDVGTNTEISLVHDGRLLCCSCASGPAFEGAHIRYGMRAAEGAIEHVQIDKDSVHLYTIGGQPPVGICGSGILDAVAEMTRAGILNHKGVLVEGIPSVRGEGGRSEFLLAAAETTGVGRDITLNRKDIQEILLAKAAIRAGIEILLVEAGIDARQIDRFLVAGAFGTYLDLRSAVEIGMFPDLPLNRFTQVGNAAGSGARQMLVSAEARRRAGDFARRMNYVELTIHPRFKEFFLKAMNVRRTLSY
jgi:uncharacterized 2Fe-2S/4Fe-4S cluster protein (DUF4445 family)